MVDEQGKLSTCTDDALFAVHKMRTELELCKRPLARLVREIALKVGGAGAQGLRYSRAAMLALQEAVEAHLAVTFESEFARCSGCL